MRKSSYAMLINPVASVDVLERCEEESMQHMNAQILLEAPQKDIPEHIER